MVTMQLGRVFRTSPHSPLTPSVLRFIGSVVSVLYLAFEGSLWAFYGLFFDAVVLDSLFEITGL